ncbi:MAG: CoA ester lyase [Sphingopyxis sp.]|nr:CoA ester lyase [Sphingopyxis sp.]
MRLRSLLFVPGDRPDRMDKARGSGADALILDLEDAVALSAKPEARLAVADFVAREAGGPAIFVRLNPLDTDLVDDDLTALAPVTPYGYVLPKSIDGASVAELAQRLTALGNRSSRILAIATEVPQALFGLGSYGGVSDRLVGLSWGAEDLPAAIGATSAREADGRYTPVYEVVRTLALMGAHAAGVLAIDTVYPAFKDLDGLAAYAARARRDGFNGMLAIHPAQVPVINAAFTPTADEVARARAVVDLFAANPGAGALALDGKMLDAPHLKAAQHILAQGA